MDPETDLPAAPGLFHCQRDAERAKPPHFTISRLKARLLPMHHIQLCWKSVMHYLPSYWQSQHKAGKPIFLMRRAGTARLLMPSQLSSINT
jgi:hypothetical protein